MRAILTLVVAAVALNSSARAEELKPLILYQIGDVPVEMRDEDEYGVMLVNDGWEEDPSPRYILAIAKTRTLIDTKDLDLFKAMLKRIPKGATLFRYGSCTVPRYWGLKEKDFEAYENAFKELDLKVSEDPRITCYCESAKGKEPGITRRRFQPAAAEDSKSE